MDKQSLPAKAGKPKIISDPKILLGKPIISGTRISVELVLDRIASGMSEKEILADYPHITSEQIQAAVAYAKDILPKGIKKSKEKEATPTVLYTHEISRWWKFPQIYFEINNKIRPLTKTVQQQRLQGSSDDTVATIALKEKRIVLTFDKDFLDNQLEDLQVIVFEFPKIPTSEIIILVPPLLKDIDKLQRLKHKIFKFSKFGLSEVV